MGVLKVGVGHATSPDEAAATAMQATPRAVLAIVFSSYGLDPHEVYRQVRARVGKAAIIGGTTAGEFSSVPTAPRTGSVAVMTLQSSYLSVGVGVGENLAGDPEGSAARAVQAAQHSLESNATVMSLMAIALDTKKAAEASRLKPFVNIILPDGCTGQEEPFMRAMIRDIGTVAQIVGGSTANDFSNGTSYQYGNGVFHNAGVIATMSSGLKIGTAMGHPYFPGCNGAVATSSSGRIVYELDRRPATTVVQEMLGVEALDADVFARNPFGIKSSDVFGEYTIKSVAHANDDGSLTFFAEIPEGAYLRHMETDREYAVNSFRQTLRRAITDAGHPRRVGAVVVFNCILRHLLKCRIDLDDLTLVREIAGDVPLIGFNTFGEQGMTLGGAVGHYNQTATMLVFGDELISQ